MQALDAYQWIFNSRIEGGEMSKGEAIHLCPICISVEMQFMERIKSDKYYRLRRFKCPVCDHSEMYIMGGPDDAERSYNERQRIKERKFREVRNQYKDYRSL